MSQKIGAFSTSDYMLYFTLKCKISTADTICNVTFSFVAYVVLEL